MMLRPVHQGVRAASRAGFTLMELLVVIAILLVLAAVATPIYMNYLAKSKEDAARSDCNIYAESLDQFANSHQEEFPQSYGYPPAESNEMLLWLYQQGFLKKKPLDPWGMPYYVEIRQIRDGVYTAFVFSGGPDRKSGTADDISAEGKGSVGP